MTTKSNILVNAILGSLFIAAVLGKLMISPGAVLACITAIYCTSALVDAISQNKKEREPIPVHVHFSQDGQVASSPTVVYQKDKAEEEKIDINTDILAQIHSRRSQDSFGQSNISNQEHESDGQQTMDSLKALQGIKDAID